MAIVGPATVPWAFLLAEVVTAVLHSSESLPLPAPMVPLGFPSTVAELVTSGVVSLLP